MKSFRSILIENQAILETICINLTMLIALLLVKKKRHVNQIQIVIMYQILALQLMIGKTSKKSKLNLMEWKTHLKTNGKPFKQRLIGQVNTENSNLTHSDPG